MRGKVLELWGKGGTGEDDGGGVDVKVVDWSGIWGGKTLCWGVWWLEGRGSQLRFAFARWAAGLSSGESLFCSSVRYLQCGQLV